MSAVLEMRDITKAFPGVLANDHVDLSLEQGEIHALLGENGAGKTTLVNVLYGLYTPDEGQVFLNGQEVHIHSPNDAIAHGIGMVHQHFMLIPVMTVAENIALGNETQRLFGVNLTIAARRLRHFLRAINPLPHPPARSPPVTSYQPVGARVGAGLSDPVWRRVFADASRPDRDSYARVRVPAQHRLDADVD